MDAADALEEAREIRTAGTGGLPIWQGPCWSRPAGKMSKRPRRHHGPAFKARVAVIVIKGERTPVGLAQQYAAVQLFQPRAC